VDDNDIIVKVRGAIVGCPGDDLIDGLLVDVIPLNNMWALENLSDDRTVAGIGEDGKPRVDTEIVEECQNRVPVPFCGLSVIPRQGKEKP